MLMFFAGLLCGACFGAVALGICYSSVSSPREARDTR